MTNTPLPDLWPPQAGEIWHTPTTSPQSSSESTLWLAYLEEITTGRGEHITTTVMMINGMGDMVPPDDLLVEQLRADRPLTLIAGDRANLHTDGLDSAELREHGLNRLLADLGPHTAGSTPW